MEETINTQKESIKLIKGAKGYRWEIKIINDSLIDGDLSKLEYFDKELKRRFKEDEN